MTVAPPDAASPGVSSMFYTPPAQDSRFLAQQPQIDAAEKARRDQIREKLLKDAQDNFEKVAPLAKNDYSKDLKKLEKEINDYLKRDPSYNGRAVVLDPNEFEAGTALGMKPRDVIRRMLKKQNVEADAVDVDILTDKMGAGYKFPVMSEVGYTQDPFADSDVGQDPDKVAVVVPASDQYPYVPGLSYAENIDFVNHHEGWHVKDDVFFKAAERYSDADRERARTYDFVAQRQPARARGAGLRAEIRSARGRGIAGRHGAQ
jgi:hypothetical protein